MWSRESNLHFSESGAGAADLRVSFVEGSHGDGYPFDGPGGTLGHAFFPGVGPSAGATHMDADEAWTYNGKRLTEWRTSHLSPATICESPPHLPAPLLC